FRQRRKARSFSSATLAGRSRPSHKTARPRGSPIRSSPTERPTTRPSPPCGNSTKAGGDRSSFPRIATRPGRREAAPGGSIVLERLLILWHFAATRWLPAPGPRWRGWRRRRFLARVRRDSPFHRGCRGEAPILTKADFLEHFADLNRHGITLEE